MKIALFILFVIAVISIALGSFVPLNYSEKLIGFGVVILFFIVFPLFSYYRWKNKELKDYMLTKENLDKMRSYKKKKKL